MYNLILKLCVLKYFIFHIIFIIQYKFKNEYSFSKRTKEIDKNKENIKDKAK